MVGESGWVVWAGQKPGHTTHPPPLSYSSRSQSSALSLVRQGGNPSDLTDQTLPLPGRHTERVRKSQTIKGQRTYSPGVISWCTGVSVGGHGVKRCQKNSHNSESTYTNLNDNELLVRARRDPAAFGELYERYVDRIYAYFYYRTGNHEDAEELTARFFHRVLERLHLYEDRGVPVAAWLYRVAHNMLANWRRDQSRRVEVPLEAIRLNGDIWVRPEDVVVAREEQQVVLDLIRELPEDRQTLLYMKFVLGATNAEIGQVLGRTEGAVKSLYHRTLVTLRRKMRQRGW